MIRAYELLEAVLGWFYGRVQESGSLEGFILVVTLKTMI